VSRAFRRYIQEVGTKNNNLEPQLSFSYMLSLVQVNWIHELNLIYLLSPWQLLLTSQRRVTSAYRKGPLGDIPNHHSKLQSYAEGTIYPCGLHHLIST